MISNASLYFELYIIYNRSINTTWLLVLLKFSKGHTKHDNSVRTQIEQKRRIKEEQATKRIKYLWKTKIKHLHRFIGIVNCPGYNCIY